jgi:hypothetical protein
MIHLQGINNSFLADLRTNFIENASMIKPEVVSITLPERQNLLKEALCSFFIYSISLSLTCRIPPMKVYPLPFKLTILRKVLVI